MVIQKNIRKQKKEKLSDLVSIVITTKNEEKNIENCLISIKNQSYKNIEIIVVDNFSTDKTIEIASRYTEKIALLGPERSAQRNHGIIDIAVGQYVIYIDADMILSPNLIEACIKTILEEKDIIALHIPEVVLGNGYFSKVRRFERCFYDGTVIDGARFFTRAKFIDVGGFDIELFRYGSGEDWDLDKKIKRIGKIGYLGQCDESQIKENWIMERFVKDRGVNYDSKYIGIYHNESDFLLYSYLRKKLYYSKGFDGYIKKWGKEDPDISKQFSIFYRFFLVFIENQKWKYLIRRIDLVIGMYFLRVLVGITFIYGKLSDKNNK